MDIWTNLLNTYEHIKPASGLVESSDNPHDDVVNQALLPLNHMTLKVSFEATINLQGELVNFKRLDKTQTVIIPCTEASMGRTSKPAPHALCDQLHYLDATLDADKARLYLEQLNQWKGDNAILNALYSYLTQHSLTKDATERFNETFTDKDHKLGVSFLIEEPDTAIQAIADKPEIREQWIAFSSHHGHAVGKDMFGQDFYTQVENFPKNIVSTAGNAKVLSANDSSGFTFRGRFANRDEALSIDSLTSQKIHNTLRWLVRTHGLITDTQAIVIWQVAKPQLPVDEPEISGIAKPVTLSWLAADQLITSNNPVEEAQQVTYQEFAKKFAKLLQGHHSPNFMSQHEGRIVILILDAASTGRLSVRYYRELQPKEYLENLARWHANIAWDIPRYKKTDDGYKREIITSSPSSDDIIRVAFGTADQTSKRYKQLKRVTRQLLIECMFSAKPVPRAILEETFNHVKHPLSYDKLSTWQTDLAVTCGLWKQYYNLNNNNRREITMALDEERTDRDYLYGRLLALADCFEERVLYVRGNGTNANRATNALRFMNNYSAHPFETYNTIRNKINPYIEYGKSNPRLVRFTQRICNTIDEVMDRFNPKEYESDEALSALYLLGYSHQRRNIAGWSTNSNEEAKHNPESAE
ncbi:hypothetical protein GCM10007377_04270 [Galliscardovia ingluviei]|uniref:Type I-C CRISPR-associated protein Cas8c/Csd1 n=1 Tax=Galliscardovia ingluviei TaxID=1769422 RepID=A0A8J3EVI6_9BIFI|nr:type I-C CRISPR-associated protein Cas8c/Csd1 [Galliscardovia ingluviei]GGI13100.1 hypothetical protein GCM10007377_04270 [Galliscardovia ingluviei]